METIGLSRIRYARNDNLVYINRKNVACLDVGHKGKIACLKDSSVNRNIGTEIRHTQTNNNADLVGNFLRLSVLCITLIRVYNDANDINARQAKV